MESQKIFIAKINEKLLFSKFLSIMQFFRFSNKKDSLLISPGPDGIILYSHESDATLCKTFVSISRIFFTEYKFFPNPDSPITDFELPSFKQIVKTMEVFKNRYA